MKIFSLSNWGRIWFRAFARIFKLEAYLEVLEKGKKDARHGWAEPFLYVGFAVAAMSSGVLLILDPLSSVVNIFGAVPADSPPSPSFAVVLAVLSFAKSLATILLAFASAMCLSAVVDVAIRVGYSIREGELRKSLRSILGIDCNDLSTEVAVVIGEVTVKDRVVKEAESTAEEKAVADNSPDWRASPQDLVSGVANDIVNSPHSEFTVLEDLKAVARIFSLLSRAGAGNPSLITATEAMREIVSLNSTVKCFVSIGLFSNVFTLEKLKSNSKQRANSPMVELTRKSRSQQKASNKLSGANDKCLASFRSTVMGNREIYEVSFDWNGKVVDSSNQLNGCDMGLISRTVILDNTGGKKCTVVCIGGFGPAGTAGGSEALRQIIEGSLEDATLQRALESGDFAAVFRVDCSNPMRIEHYRTYS